MRTIKFRAFHKGEKRMIACGDMLYLDDFFSIIMGDPDAYEIMQYTGLLDKNGKPIFEGDILQYEKGENLGKITGAVNFKQGRFILGESTKNNYLISPSFGKVHKIIGNVYENPELLK